MGLKKARYFLRLPIFENGVLPSRGEYYRISNTIHHRMAKTRIAEHDVLLNIVGATLDVIGRSGFVAKLEGEANITQAMVFLRSRTPNLLSGYLFAFLNTNYGKDQVARYARPTGQYNLNLQEVGHILIPLIPLPEQEAIETLILNSSELLENSYDCYTAAQQLLESELDLDRLTFKKPVGYTARFKELEKSRRADPEHFYPAFQNLVTNLPDSINLVPLGHQLTFCQRGKQPVYAEKGLPVINSKHVQNNKVVVEDNRTARQNNGRELQIRNGDVLMNGTGRGTIGRAAPYLLENKTIPDNHVTILRSVALDPAYLSFYLNSLAGQLQVEMHQRGSSGQLELYPFDIRKFLVWMAPESFQKEIRKIYEHAMENERKSKALLEESQNPCRTTHRGSFRRVKGGPT
jgi:restriction endonuclease S subunit